MYEITYKKSAAKTLAKIPTKIATQFMAGFELIAQDDASQLDIKKLQNRDGYRLRIGSYRAIYQIIEDTLTIEVLKIGSRGDIYK